MTLEEATREVTSLLARIRSTEDFIARAEAWYKDRNNDWHSSIAARIEIFLERKREQVQDETRLASQIGLNIAMGRYPKELEE